MVEVKEIFSKLNYYSFLILVFFSTISDRLLIYSLNIWILFSLIDLIINKRYKQPFFKKKNMAYLMYILFFLYTILLYFFSAPNNNILNIMTRRLSFFLIPLFGIYCINKYYNFQQIVKLFALGVLGSIVLILGKSITNYYFGNIELNQISNKLLYFQNELLTLRHRSYWGLYSTISLILLLSLLYRNKLTTKEKYVYIFLCIIICAIILILDSRVTLVSLLLVVLFILLFSNKKGIHKKGLLPLLFIIPIIILGFYFSNRFEVVWQYFQSDGHENIYSVDPRGFIWKYSVTILKNNWLFGCGPGNVQKHLNELYTLNNFELGVKNSYNAHNQFLQTFLEGGVVSLLILISILSILIYQNRKSKFNILILAVVCLNFVFEAYLERICGIFLFSTLPIFLSLARKNPKPAIQISFLNKDNFFKIVLLILFLLVFFLLSFLSWKNNIDPNRPETYAKKPYNKVTIIDSTNNPNGIKINGIEVNEDYYIGNFDNTNQAYMILKSKRIKKNDSIDFSIKYMLPEKVEGLNVGIAIGGNMIGYQIKMFDESETNKLKNIKVSASFKQSGHALIFIIFRKENENIVPKGKIILAYPEINFYKK